MYDYENEYEAKDFTIEVLESVSRICQVNTSEYLIDIDYDEDLKQSVETIDTKDVDWIQEYTSKHYTVLELINELKMLIDEKLSNKDISIRDRDKYISMRKDCEDWKQTEIIVDKIQPI